MNYIKLAQVKHTDLHGEIDSDCNNMYIAVEKDCDFEYAETLQEAKQVTVECVAVIGDAFATVGGEVRCFAREAEAYKDAQGMMWLDVEMYEEVFC